MKRKTRKFITRLKKMSHEEIYKALQGFVDCGRTNWDGYYDNFDHVDVEAKEQLNDDT